MELKERSKKLDFGALFNFRRSEVSDFFKDCRSLIKTKDLVVLAKESSDLDHGKLLCILSRKVACAVARNRMRRLAKNIFFENQLYKSKTRLVFIFKPKSILDRKALEEIFEKISSKIVFSLN